MSPFFDKMGMKQQQEAEHEIGAWVAEAVRGSHDRGQLGPARVVAAGPRWAGPGRRWGLT